MGDEIVVLSGFRASPEMSLNWSCMRKICSSCGDLLFESRLNSVSMALSSLYPRAMGNCRVLVGLFGSRPGSTMDRGLRIELLAIFRYMGSIPRLKLIPEEKRPWATPRVRLKEGQGLPLIPLL